jgi:hypothetical protein
MMYNRAVSSEFPGVPNERDREPQQKADQGAKSGNDDKAGRSRGVGSHSATGYQEQQHEPHHRRHGPNGDTQH